MPALPKPAMARPIISINEDVASPHIKEPSSKKKRKNKNIHCYPVKSVQGHD
jgi:hypothetical protein